MSDSIEVISRDGSPVMVAGAGAGGGAIVVPPLSEYFWVDPNTTTPAPKQNGSAATPYASIQQAIDANPGTLVVACGRPNVTENVTLPNNTTLFLVGPFTLQGTLTTGGGCFVLTYNVNLNGTVTLGASSGLFTAGQGAPLNGIDNPAGAASIFIDAANAGVTLQAINGQSDTTVHTRGCSHAGNITAGQVFLEDFGLSANVTCTGFTANNQTKGSNMSGKTIAQSAPLLGVNLTNAYLPGAAYTNAGKVYTDALSQVAVTFSDPTKVEGIPFRVAASGSQLVAKGGSATLGPFQLNPGEVPRLGCGFTGAITHDMGITDAPGPLPNPMLEARRFRANAAADGAWSIFFANSNPDDDVTVQWVLYADRIAHQ